MKVTGVTVHFANEDYDKGPIVAQEPVRVAEDDTLETLETHIHQVEHELYPRVLGWIAAGRVSVDDAGHVHVAPEGGAAAQDKVASACTVGTHQGHYTLRRHVGTLR